VNVTLKMPRVSMNMEEGTLVARRKQPGENFAEGDILYDIKTEKVTSEYETPCSGVMLEHLADEGDDVPVGDDVRRINKT
jgi:pyruvate/2-oxoglutarate dehydrogenase complex dihydrolipoamide acyltransferase (E2) component